MNQTFMKERPVLPLILSMSIPSMLSMLVNSLYNIVDSLFVARLGENALTALSIVFPLQNVSLALSVGFGVGVGALISISMGMQREEQVNRAGSTGLLLCTIHGVIVMIISIAVIRPFMGLFTGDAEVLQMGIEYGVVVSAFCVPQHLYIGMEKIFQSVGRMKTSMIAMMIGSVSNIILDPVMIFGLGPVPAMGIAGAALATGIGHLLAMGYYFLMIKTNPIPVQFQRKNIRFEKRMLGRIYSVGIPASLNIALPSLLISALNSILTAYSQVYIMVLGVYYKLQTFVYMPANGLVQGIRPIIGYNFGAGESARVKKIYRMSLMLSTSIMLLGSVICLTMPETLIGFFSESGQTIEIGATALMIISYGFIASSVSITSCGALEGLGMGFHSLIISLIRFVICIIPLAWVLSSLIGPEGVWHSFWITECVAAVVSYLLYHHVLHKHVAAKALKEN